MDEAQVKALIEAATGPLVSKIAELESSSGQVAEAVKKIGEIEGNVKVLSDTVAAQTPLDRESLKAELRAELQAELAAEQAKTAEQQAADKLKAEEAAKADSLKAQLQAKREAYAAEKLKGVPPKYHALSDDESKWDEEEKAIRQQFAADLQAAGIKVADLGGSAGGTPPSGDQADKSFAALLK